MAVMELERRMGLEGTVAVTIDPDDLRSEAYAQSQVRLEAPHYECLLTRNNVGALQDKEGQWVRYGLFNESKKQNKRFKSWDLVGMRKRLITPHMVPPEGLLIGQFVGREIKHPGWVYTGDEHEQAQLNAIQLGLSYGADCAFATGAGSFR